MKDVRKEGAKGRYPAGMVLGVLTQCTVPDGKEGRDRTMAAAVVLVVDDDPTWRRLLRVVLVTAGYAVEEAPDGRVALERLRQHPAGLVVLLDVHMPEVSGIQVMEAVATDPGLVTRHRYLVMTAAPTLPLAFANLLSKLQVPILSKPFTADELLAQVGRAAGSLQP
jgi:CheY-like chemotaxis protein